MFRVIRTLGLAFGLLGGGIAAQGPEFAQQYAQRLGGTVDELRRQIDVLETDARATGTTREGAVERMRGNPDQLVARRGAAAQGDIERLAALSAQQQAIASATSPLGRLIAVIRQPDASLARATYRDYQPALPTTADGVVAGLLGFVATWAVWRLISDLGRRAARRRPREQITAA